MSDWVDLGDGIRVRQSRLFQMNSVILLDERHAVIVDPGVLPAELDEIAREVRAPGARAMTLILTHAHWDHVLGQPWFPVARTLAHDRFEAEARRDLEHIRTESAKHAAENGAAYPKPFEPFAPNEAVSGLRFLKLEPWRLVLRDAAGHSASQISIHLPEQRVLIAADMLSDIEIPALEGPCATYLETLKTLEPVFEAGAIEVLIPGHGSIAHGPEAARVRLRRDMDYLEALERRVGEARATGLTAAVAAAELTAMTYGGQPIAGAYNAQMHIENIRLTWQGLSLTAPGKPTRGGPGGKYRPRG